MAMAIIFSSPTINTITITITTLVFVVVVIVLRSLLTPLRNVPGPFLARFSRLWYLIHILKGNWEKVDVELHRRYGKTDLLSTGLERTGLMYVVCMYVFAGPIVRIAPNEYSIDDVDAVRVIYGLGTRFTKVNAHLKLLYICAYSLLFKESLVQRLRQPPLQHKGPLLGPLANPTRGQPPQSRAAVLGDQSAENGALCARVHGPADLPSGRLGSYDRGGARHAALAAVLRVRRHRTDHRVAPVWVFGRGEGSLRHVQSTACLSAVLCRRGRVLGAASAALSIAGVDRQEWDGVYDGVCEEADRGEEAKSKTEAGRAR